MPLSRNTSYLYPVLGNSLPSLHGFSVLKFAPKQREARFAKANWPYGFRLSPLRRRRDRDKHGLADWTRL